jgi:hypothetical protein
MADFNTLAQVRNLIATASGLFTYNELESNAVEIEPTSGRTLKTPSRGAIFQVEFYTYLDAVAFANSIARLVTFMSPYSEIIVQPTDSGNFQVVFDP